MRTLLALIALLTLAACGTATTTTGTRLAGTLTIAEVTQAFRDHGLAVAATTSAVAAPSSSADPSPLEGRRILNRFNFGVDLYSFANDAEARDFADTYLAPMWAGGKRYVHRNIVMACSDSQPVECQKYFTVLVSLR